MKIPKIQRTGKLTLIDLGSELIITNKLSNTAYKKIMNCINHKGTMPKRQRAKKVREILSKIIQ